MTLDRLRAALSEALGRRVHSIAATAGATGIADVADGDGARVFVKWSDGARPRQFESEARGLLALRDAADASLCHVPEPLAWSDAAGAAFLALPHLTASRKRKDYDELLGRALATIHRATSPRGFGFEVDGYCGATPQPNGFLPSWPEFFRERRLLHQARLARERGMASRDVAILERLAERVAPLLSDTEPPSLIHGDLWAGNVLVADDGRPALIDPAAYFADREAEFGMMHLFGNFGERTYAAYRESFPLREGFESRLDLYRLYHLLNHFNLFGGDYGARAIDLARRLPGGSETSRWSSLPSP